MGWQDDLTAAIEEHADRHGLADVFSIAIPVSATVGRQLGPELVGHVNARPIGRYLLAGHLKFDGCDWSRTVDGPGDYLARFMVRISLPWNRCWVHSGVVCIGTAELVDVKGVPLYPPFDFGQIKDSWRDLPALF